MEIKNAKIRNVTVYLDDLKRLTVTMELHDSVGFVTANFRLVNPVAVINLTQIMKYTNATNLTDLEEKIVRVGIFNQNIVRSIGHPVEDEFVVLER